MAPTILFCEQGSPDWYAARLGIPTSSEFKTVLAKGRGGKGDSLTRATYMRKLCGERLTGELMDNYSNANMERGKAMEAEARDLYAFAADVEPEIVGFVRNGAKGCSPDSLVGDSGMLEIKTAFPHILIQHLLRGPTPPPEHLPQCQGQLWVAEREWVDLMIYWPKMPPYQHRMYRDEPYIKTLEHAVDRFNEELEAMVEKVRSYAG